MTVDAGHQRTFVTDLDRIGHDGGIVIAPAVIGAPPLELGRHAALAAEGGADVIHVDIMDGHFAPMITYGHALVEHLKAFIDLPLDVHLLTANPERHIPKVIAAGADIVTIHVEACVHSHQSLTVIKELGAKAGIAVNPGTPLVAIEELIPFADLLLIMTVNPGESRLIESLLTKVRAARTMLDRAGQKHVPVAVDGGVKPSTIGRLAAAGATWFVAASAVFGTNSTVAEAIHMLRKEVEIAVEHRS